MSTQRWLWTARSIEKEVVGIEGLVAKEVVGISVIFVAARFGDGLDIPAGITSLRSVVKAGLHDELLQRIRGRDGNIRR